MRTQRWGSHFHGPLWSQITLQHILKSAGSTNIHSQGGLGPRHLGFWVQRFHGSHGDKTQPVKGKTTACRETRQRGWLRTLAERSEFPEDSKACSSTFPARVPIGQLRTLNTYVIGYFSCQSHKSLRVMFW